MGPRLPAVSEFSSSKYGRPLAVVSFLYYIEIQFSVFTNIAWLKFICTKFRFNERMPNAADQCTA